MNTYTNKKLGRKVAMRYFQQECNSPQDCISPGDNVAKALDLHTDTVNTGHTRRNIAMDTVSTCVHLDKGCTLPGTLFDKVLGGTQRFLTQNINIQKNKNQVPNLILKPFKQNVLSVSIPDKLNSQHVNHSQSKMEDFLTKTIKKQLKLQAQLDKRNDSRKYDYVKHGVQRNETVISTSIPESKLKVIDFIEKEIGDIEDRTMENFKNDLPTWTTPEWTGKSFVEALKKTKIEPQEEKHYERGLLTKRMIYDIFERVEENRKLHGMLDNNAPNYCTQVVLQMYVDMNSLVHGPFKFWTMSPDQYKVLRRWIKGEAKILDFLSEDLYGKEKLKTLLFIRKNLPNKWKEIVMKLQATASAYDVKREMNRKTNVILKHVMLVREGLPEDKDGKPRPALARIGSISIKRTLPYKNLYNGMKTLEWIDDSYNERAYRQRAIYDVDAHLLYGHFDIDRRASGFISVKSLRDFLDIFSDDYLEQRYKQYCREYNIVQPQAIPDLRFPRWLYSFGNDTKNAIRALVNFVRSGKDMITTNVSLLAGFIRKIYNSLKSAPDTVRSIVNFSSDWMKYVMRITVAIVCIVVGFTCPYGEYMLLVASLAMEVLKFLGAEIDQISVGICTLIGTAMVAAKHRPSTTVTTTINNYLTPQAFDFRIVQTLLAGAFSCFVCMYMPYDAAFKSFFEKCDRIPKALSGIHRMTDFFEEQLSSTFSYLYKKATGEELVLDNSIPSEVTENYNEIRRLAVMGTYSTMCSDPSICLEIERVYHSYLSLRTRYSDNRIISNFMNTYTGTVVDLFKKAATANPRMNSERAKPTCVMFKGTTGVGKSALTYFLAAAILKYYGCLENCTPEQQTKKINECIYARNGMQEFFDGYLNQLVTVIDDFGAQKDSQTNPNPDFNDLLRMVNNFPYPLPMASISQKANTFFTSRFVFLTTNLETIEPASMINPEALRSRISHAYCIKIKPEWQIDPTSPFVENHRLDTAKTRRHFGNKTVVDVYQFTKIDIVTNDIIQDNLSFDDILKDILQHRNSEESFFLNKQESLMTFLNDKSDIIGRANTEDVSRVMQDFGNPMPSTSNLQPQNHNIDIMNIKRDMDRAAIRRFLNSVKDEYFVNTRNHAIFPKCLIDAWTINSIYEHIKDFIPYKDEAKRSEYWRQLQLIHHANARHFQDWHLFSDLMVYDYLHTDVKYYNRYIYQVPEELLSNAQTWESLHVFLNDTPLVNIEQIYSECKTSEIEIALKWYCANNPISLEVGTEPSWKNLWHLLTPWRARRVVEMTNPYLQPGQQRVINNNTSMATYIMWALSTTSIILMIVAGIAGIYTVLTKQEESQEQENNQEHGIEVLKHVYESGKDKKTVLINKYESGKDKKNVLRQTKFESFTSTQAEEISKMARSNFRWLWIAGRHFANCLVIRGHYTLINYHYKHMLAKFDPDTELVITAPHQSNGTAIPISSILDGQRIQRGEESTDLWLFKLPRNANMGSDIIKHFHSKKDIALVNKYNNYLLTIPRPSGWISHVTKHVKTHTQEQTLILDDDERSIISCQVYEFDARTSSGDCGGIYVADSDRLKSKIIGFHFAGTVDGGAMAIPLLREDFEHLCSTPTIVTPQGLNFEEPDKLKTLNGVIPIGKSTPVHNSTKTTLEKTKLYNRIFESTMKPAQLGRLLKEDGPGIKGLQKVTPTVPYISDKEVTIARHDLDTKILRNERRVTRVLTFEEAVHGQMDEKPLYIKGINRSTSAGYPYCLDKRHGKKEIFGNNDYVFGEEANRVKERVMKRIKDMKEKHEYEQTIYVDTLKDETRTIEKVDAGKTRVFSAASLDLVILFRMYFMGFLNHIMENKILNEVCVGICAQSPDWNKLALTLLSKGNNIVAGDFSNYDGTLNPNILWAICDMANDYYKDGNDEIRQLIFEDIVHSIHIAEDNVYAWTHSQPSGNPGTAIINSIYNSLATRIVYNRLTKGTEYYRNFSKYISMVSYGDDNLISIHKEIVNIINQQTLTAGFKEIGMTYTDESKQLTELPYKKLAECSFLKRGFRKEDSISLWVGPLQMPSIMERLNWQHKHPQPEEITILNAEGAIAELAFHNKETFDKWSVKIKEQVLEVFEENIPLYEREYYLHKAIDGEYEKAFPQLTFT